MKIITARLIGHETHVRQFYDTKPSSINIKTLTKLSFELGMSYVANEKTVTEVKYKIYYHKAGSKDPYVPANEDEKDQTIKLKGNIASIEEGFEEKFGGTEIVISFGVLNPYTPPFQDNNTKKFAGTVKYFNVISCEKVPSRVKSAVWSSKEKIEFGKSSPKHSAICRNEDAFLHIETRGMFGKKVRIELFEKDYMPPNQYLLLGVKEDVQIYDNVACVPVEMDGVYSKANNLRWFEGDAYEIVARITPNDTSIEPFYSEVINNLNIDKIAPDNIAQKSTITGTAKFVIGSMESDEEKQQDCKCPRCRETSSDMQERLKQCFPNADDNVLKEISETYCKYMGELKMDTCWIKSHFFAQIAIESGITLSIAKGENMNYSRTRLEDIFPSRIFKGKNIKGKWVSDRDKLGQRIYQEGKKAEIDAIYQKTDKAEREKAITNFVYATTNGNKGGDDGWNFRGRGLVQLTGRENYEALRSKVLAKNLGNIIENPDLVCQNYEVATYTSMLYLYDRGIAKENMANGQKNTLFISKKVGKEHSTKDKKSTNHKDKQEFFDKYTSVTFKIDKCDFNEKSSKNEIQFKDMIEYYIYGNGHSKEYKTEKYIPKTNKMPDKYKYIYMSLQKVLSI